MKICKDCKHLQAWDEKVSFPPSFAFTWPWKKFPEPEHYIRKHQDCRAPIQDPVSGEFNPFWGPASFARSVNGPCGPDGKLWEAKE